MHDYIIFSTYIRVQYVDMPLFIHWHTLTHMQPWMWPHACCIFHSHLPFSSLETSPGFRWRRFFQASNRHLHRRHARYALNSPPLWSPHSYDNQAVLRPFRMKVDTVETHVSYVFYETIFGSWLNTWKQPILTVLDTNESLTLVSEGDSALSKWCIMTVYCNEKTKPSWNSVWANFCVNIAGPPDIGFEMSKPTNTKKWIDQLLRKFHPADSQAPDSPWVPDSPPVPVFGSRRWTRCQYRHHQDGGSGGGSHGCWAAPRAVVCQHCSPFSPLEFLTLGKHRKARFVHVLVKMLWSSKMIFPMISPEPALLPQSRLLCLILSYDSYENECLCQSYVPGTRT